MDTGDHGLIIDCDVHPVGVQVKDYLPERWRTYLADVGRRNYLDWGLTVPLRPGSARLDASPPDGGPAGSDPAFAREQLLDGMGIAAAILNDVDPLTSGGLPVEFEVEYVRATNLHNFERWLGDDPRWHASISIAPDNVAAAVEEIERCRERSERFVQILTTSKTERPAGNRKYWPIYEAAVELDLPIGVHIAPGRMHAYTGGGPTYYYEVHAGNPLHAEPLVASMIFEGVFDRFPSLRVVLTELAWDWAVSFGWRMDATWRVLKGEVAHLERKPSDYLRDHFWYTTQPLVEPEEPVNLADVWEQLTDAGLDGHLVYSSDYPHWDMDSPLDAVPRSFSDEARAKILYRNALGVYKLQTPALVGA
jgi:predicted TIM-barrel fold metal-dependent hydrolase